MKKKYFFLTAAIAILSLAGCTKERPAPDGPDGSGILGYLTVKFTSPDLSSRTAGTPTDPGLSEESEINSVTIVFTDANGLIRYVKTPTLVPSTTTTQPFTVEVGTYKLYALINNPSGSTLVVGENIQRVIPVASAAAAEGGLELGSFFMVNARHNGSQEAGVDVTINNTHIATNPYHATVFVDRVAVKVQEDTPSPTFTPTAPANFPSTVASLQVEGFVMLNINKSFNRIQEWGDENTNGLPLDPDVDVLQTPLYAAGPGALVSGQYYRNISEYTTLGKDGSGNITSLTDIAKDITPSPFTFGVKYATENRPTIIVNTLKLTAGQGETTGVIYKVVARDAGGAAVSTFYEYRDVFYASVAEVEVGGGFSAGELTPLSIPEIRGKGVRVYENGVMYYTHFITDPNLLYQYRDMDYYGVFRNSVYRLTINGFSNIGDDVPGGGRVDPNNPDEPGNPPIDVDEAYIDVEITINPWVLNEIGIDF